MPNRMMTLIELRKREQHPSLAQLLEDHRFCGATDLRNHVYGLVGVLEKHIIPIDYNLNTANVVQAATSHVIQESKNLEIFHSFQPWRGPDRNNSWTLNFDGSRPAGLLPLRIRTIFRMPMTYENEVIPPCLVSGNIVCIKGKYIESVYMVSQPLTATPLCRPGSEEFTRVIYNWELVAAQMIKKRFQRPISAAFSDTLVCSSDPSSFHYDEEDKSPTASPAFEDWYAKYGTDVLKNREPNFFNQQDEEKNGKETYMGNGIMNPMALHCYERQLFTTDQGSLGMGRPEVQTGDQIVFFPGAMYPFILRPRADGTFSFCGDCYLYGFNYLEFGRTVEENAVEFVIQ